MNKDRFYKQSKKTDSPDLGEVRRKGISEDNHQEETYRRYDQ